MHPISLQQTTVFSTWLAHCAVSGASLTGALVGSGSVGRIRPFDALPAPQLLTVMITGSILNEAQIAQGSYMPRGEQERALQLLQGT